ncbi:hypothetical protein B0H11DRAFT_2261784 [Mycena galericulata]|nr:hypothetical protein B0H11DRAFT_2261784 [Mycena galericulata]
MIPTCQDFEDRLIKLLWRSRPTGSSNVGSLAGSVTFVLVPSLYGVNLVSRGLYAGCGTTGNCPFLHPMMSSTIRPQLSGLIQILQDVRADDEEDSALIEEPYLGVTENLGNYSNMVEQTIDLAELDRPNYIIKPMYDEHLDALA